MQKYIFLILATFMFPVFGLASSNDYSTLDSLINKKSQIIEQKLSKIKIITNMLNTEGLTDAERYAINDRLYNEYVALKYDSAYKYSEQNLKLATKLQDKKKWLHSILQQIHILSVAGLFEEANILLQDIDDSLLDIKDQIAYYETCSEYYLYKSEFYQDTQFYRFNLNKLNECRIHILSIAPPNSYNYTVTLASTECEKGNYAKAIALLESWLPRLKSGTRPYSIITNTLAFFYQCNKNEQQRKHYLILSAISDLKGGITENNAMRELSSMLLNENDVERANKYLNISVNDAAFYGTRLRNIQASQLLPQIEGAYKAYAAIKDRNKQILLISVTFVALLLLVAIGICVFSLKKYRLANEKVHIANKELNKLVEQLKVLNGQMAENNHLKEQYISRFLQLAGQFIDMSNERQKNLNRLARDHKLPELYAELKSQSYIQLLESMFYQNFDSAFLNIYPNFIVEVNKLLLPEMIIEQRNNKKMTTELRILALIRLGITDNNSISRILNASMTTIYTYRSKLKGRARAKNTFEEKVKLIDVSYPIN